MSEENVINYPMENFTASLVKLIGSTVKAEIFNSQTVEGIVYSIDPISGSIFLVLGSTLKLLIGSGIKRLHIIRPSNVNFLSLLNENSIEATVTDETEKNRDSLYKWFSDRHIQVVLDGANLNIFNEVTINPPYSPDNCSSLNEIMLNRVRKILQEYYTK